MTTRATTRATTRSTTRGINAAIGGSSGPSFSPSYLVDAITPDWWYAPLTATPGYDAVAAASRWTRTGTATGFYTGPVGQEVVRQPVGGTHYAARNASTFAGKENPWERLDNTSQFWILIGWDPRGSTNTVSGLFLTGGSNSSTAGIRVYANAVTGVVVMQISDGVGQHSMFHTIYDYDDALFNTILFQFDLTGTASIESWSNGFGNQQAGGNYQAISGPVWSGTPIANTYPVRIGDADGLPGEGDIMAAGGTGVLTKREISALLNYGRGLAYADLSAKPHSETDYYRPTIASDTAGDSVRVVGKWDTNASVKLYLPGADRTIRGALAATGTISRDEYNRGECLFEGLANDTKYHGIVEYGGEECTQEFRLRTPKSTINGQRIIFAGCWEYLEAQRTYKSNLGINFRAMATLNPDFVVSTGDDWYLDTAWSGDMAQAGVAETLEEMESVLDYLERKWEATLFRQLPFVPGQASDHDLYNNDQDSTASNIANAVTMWRKRYGALTFETAGKLYRSWRTPGFRWIQMDCISDQLIGTRIVSAAQIEWIRLQCVAARENSEFVILLTDRPFEAPGTPPPQAWNYDATNIANRLALFDALVASNIVASGRSQILIVTGDFHATGVDSGATQSNFDTGGIANIPTINAARLVHAFGEGSFAGWDLYASNVQGQFVVVDCMLDGADCDLTITPYTNGTAGTPITGITLVQ